MPAWHTTCASFYSLYTTYTAPCLVSSLSATHALFLDGRVAWAPQPACLSPSLLTRLPLSLSLPLCLYIYMPVLCATYLFSVCGLCYFLDLDICSFAGICSMHTPRTCTPPLFFLDCLQENRTDRHTAPPCLTPHTHHHPTLFPHSGFPSFQIIYYGRMEGGGRGKGEAAFW